MATDFYYPFDSIKGDRKTTAATERRFWSALFSNGVVGAGGFAITETASGVYSVAPGVALVGGAVCGNVTAKSITAKPSQGSKLYIALRLDTTSAKRDVDLITTATLEDDTAEQLEQGGKLDLPLYSVEGLTGGAYGVLDMREYCTSFDNVQYKALFDAMLAAMEADGTQQVSAIVASLNEALEEANTEIAGMYGAQGRQGFINPCFEVNQRGQSSYSIQSGMSYTFDRWHARIGGASASDAVSIDRVQDGARMALRIANKAYAAGTSAAASYVGQNIEGGVRRFCNGAKKFTVSFDAKSSAATKLAVEPTQYPVSGGAGYAIAAQSVDLTTSWQRFSLTFTGTQQLTAEQFADVLKIGFYFAWRANNDRFGADNDKAVTVYLANMQINEGTSALPCYVKPYADELEACLRYYAAFGYVTLSCASQNAANKQLVTSPLPLTRRMRAMPTATVQDRLNVTGRASVELVSGTWRNGLAVQLSNNSEQNPVFVVTNSDAADVTRVCLNSVALDAEIKD